MVRVRSEEKRCAQSNSSLNVHTRANIHMGDDRTMAVQEELTSLLDSALRMGEVNGGAEWSNALLFDDVLRRPKDDGSSRGDTTASTTENMTSSEDATKWRFDTARRLGTVSLYICYVIFIFGLHDVKSLYLLKPPRVSYIMYHDAIRVSHLLSMCVVVLKWFGR